jgi:hypothetical protein
VPRSHSASCLLPLILVLGAFVYGTPASAGLVLNEILYDPDGPDVGSEFVELWNSDSLAVSLEGVALESGDGSRSGTWTTIYTGVPGDSAAPRSPFLIPATALLGAIQNGPDALRLTRGSDVLDLVGYGALTAPDRYQGAPAEDVPSGQSLARLRDGVDTGSNAADWAAEPEPTPGRANHPDVRLALTRGSAALDPEVPWPGQVFTLSVVVRNRGRLTVEGARWRLEALVRSAAGEDTSWAGPPALGAGRSLAPGESAVVRCAMPAREEGRFEVRAILRDLGGTGSVADTSFFSARAGAGPLLIHEIAFHDRGAGEWVELLARGTIPDLGAFSLSDAGGHRYAVDRGSAPRAAGPGDLLVLAEAPAAVRAFYDLPESLVLGCEGGWPALNDTDAEDGIADRVRVWDSAGVRSDAVPYRAEYSEREGSLERLGPAFPSGSASSWAECIDARSGTPGRPNSMHAPGSSESPPGRLLVADPPVLRRPPGRPVSPVVLSFGAVARGARVRVLVHDLLGRTRRHLVDGQRVLGEAAFLWDGRDDGGAPVPAGAYVARAETIPDHAEPERSGSLALTVMDR